MAAGGCSSAGEVSQQLKSSSKSAKPRAVTVDSGAVSTWQGWESGGKATCPLSMLPQQMAHAHLVEELAFLPQGNMVWLLDSVIPVVFPSLETH